MKKKLAIIVKGPENGVSFYRGFGPFQHLERLVSDEWEFHYKSTIPPADWSIINQFDAFFIQRPSKRGAMQFANACKQMGKHVWFDYDDDFLTIPYGNPAHMAHVSESSKKEFVSVVNSANVVTVSTEHLLKKYKPFNDNTVIVPNAYMENLLPWPRYKEKPMKMNCLWRGTKTHESDVNVHLKQIIRALEHCPNLSITFLGEASMTAHYELSKRFPDRFKCVGPFDVITFQQLLSQLEIAFTIVPLIDDDFNKAKSNIAYIESAYAGGATIAPNWPEWQRPGVYNYNDDKDLGHCMIDLAEDFEKTKRLAKEAFDHVKNELHIDKVNELRKEVLKKLSKLSAY